MKTFKLLPLLLVISLLAFAFIDAFQELGITKAEAEDYIMSSVTNGAPSIPGKARTIAMANRPTIVQAIGSFAKSYVHSDHFKSNYAEWWNGQEPTKPQTPEQKAGERKQQEIEAKKSQEESVANLKKELAKTKDPATKKMYEEVLKITIQTIASTQTPEFKESAKKMADMMTQMEAEEYKTNMAAYELKMKEWQSQKDPAVFIKAGLQKFLAETEAIDFNAKLKTNEYGAKIFVNEEYESKGGYWKQAFRAGKPTVDAGRVIAKQWLSEMK
jgi:ribonuclease BN (tRNA processing enzyme)